MQYQGVCRHAARVGLALCAMGLSTRPAAAEDLSAAVTPFVLQADDPARARAVHCLTQAIYYEAGTEPLSGQQAVAQVVLNRLKHPAFPKSVCGVVFEGAGRSSGCQFSFTCDASLSRQPVAWRWNAAQRVAEAALSGFVDTEVGTSTHYHAAWMTPYWSASLIRTGRIGGHIFYRLPGAAGTPEALSGQYLGAEPSTAQGLAGVDRNSRAPASGQAQFSAWGLVVATVSSHRGTMAVTAGG